MEDYVRLSFLIEIFISAILLSGIYAVSEDRVSLFFALVTGVPALFINWSFQIFKIPSLLLIHHICAALFFATATVIIVRHLINQKVVTVDLIWGAVCGYFFIGFMWSAIFSLLETFHPGSFKLGSQVVPNIDSFIYFSFVTLATLGYGDIVPLTEKAQSLAIIETVMGQMYLAVNIAALVAIRISQSRNKDP
ncbi:MAG: two pore domain potassium channel family protein [Desulfobacteraceae bacterium]|uniref:Two pore domain potassium channel family protein n=1 Tax=Candidatus Desulfacyla euxinica TaxID=2841693 RepID=A0A8J6T2A4_9DELT|nr:two pore domain potassium channel family protein [Candidatus Desulfacyla euxinica]MBL6979261.1 two pore domain potassium channel family protein [Desulfobacteraceae bacterium]MBL7218277.1 two pore domain potassium channel family protein [Desulfobacteraceae bacterium]